MYRMAPHKYKKDVRRLKVSKALVCIFRNMADSRTHLPSLVHLDPLKGQGGQEGQALHTGSIWKATADMAATFGLTVKNAACGAANICAALEICRQGASHELEHTFASLFGKDKGWLKREGRFLGCYLKPMDGGTPIEFTDEFRKRAEAVDCQLDTLKSAEQINAKVSEVTKKKIQQIITSEVVSDESLLLVALAAEYLKVEWSIKFNAKRTTNQPFTKFNGTKVTCPMMYLEDKLRYQKMTTPSDGTYELMLLNTSRGKERTTTTVYGMVALPGAGVTIEEMMRDISKREDEIRDLALNGTPRKAILRMPRLEKKMEAMNIGHIVTSFGLGAVFSPGAFDRMVQSKTDKKSLPLNVGAIYHATYLKWNEEGAEAAAATAVAVYRSLSQPKPIEMVCNRPFVCYLIDVPAEPVGRTISPTSVLFSMVVDDESCFDMQAPEAQPDDEDEDAMSEDYYDVPGAPSGIFHNDDGYDSDDYDVPVYRGLCDGAAP